MKKVYSFIHRFKSAVLNGVPRPTARFCQACKEASMRRLIKGISTANLNSEKEKLVKVLIPVCLSVSVSLSLSVCLSLSHTHNTNKQTHTHRSLGFDEIFVELREPSYNV